MTELDERVRELISTRHGDDAATAVIESLGAAILGYLRTLHSDDDAEDVFQMWAEDLWRGITGFRGECPIRAWAYRVAWHASARFLREPWRQRREALPTSAASRLAASVARSAPLGRGDERLELLRRHLDPLERTLLLLRLDREMPWDHIAMVLEGDGESLTPVALRKRFQRLKDRLGELARKNGLL